MNAKGAYSLHFQGPVSTETGGIVNGNAERVRVIVYPKSNSREYWRALHHYCANNGIALTPIERDEPRPDGRYDALYAIANDAETLALLLDGARNYYVTWHHVYDAKPGRGSGQGTLSPRAAREIRKSKWERRADTITAESQAQADAESFDAFPEIAPCVASHGLERFGPETEPKPYRKPRRNRPDVQPAEYSDEQRDAALTDTYKDEALRSALLRRGATLTTERVS